MIANAVSRRTKEMGIRLALGAEPWRVVRMIVREAGVLIAIGIAIGAPSGFALGRTGHRRAASRPTARTNDRRRDFRTGT